VELCGPRVSFQVRRGLRYLLPGSALPGLPVYAEAAKRAKYLPASKVAIRQTRPPTAEATYDKWADSSAADLLPRRSVSEPASKRSPGTCPNTYTGQRAKSSRQHTQPGDEGDGRSEDVAGALRCTAWVQCSGCMNNICEGPITRAFRIAC